MVYEPNNDDAVQALDDYVLNKKDRGFAVISPGDGIGSGAYAVTVNSGNLDASDTLSVGSTNDEALFDGSTVSLSDSTNVQINSVSDAVDGTEQYRYDVLWIDNSGEVNKTEGSVIKLSQEESDNNLTRFQRFKGSIPKPGTDPATVIAVVIVNSNDTGVSSSQLKDYRVDAQTSVNTLNGPLTTNTSLSDIASSGLEIASSGLQILSSIWDAANSEVIADVNNSNTTTDALKAKNVSITDLTDGSTNAITQQDETDESTEYSSYDGVQRTLGVSTSDTVIFNLELIAMQNAGEGGGVVTVSGRKDGAGNRFSDIVHVGRILSPSVVSSLENDSPAARTYSRNGTDLELSMSSDTYDVIAVGKMGITDT